MAIGNVPKLAKERLGRCLTEEEADRFARGIDEGPITDSFRAHIVICPVCSGRNLSLKKKYGTW